MGLSFFQIRSLTGFTLTVSAILVSLANVGLGVEHATVLAAANSITASELQTHVSVLADDSFEGRAAGTRGGRAAGMYLLQELEKRGLRGAGDSGTYFQSFGNGYRNVLAKLEGSDPQLKHEFIVIGAHYDHVGYGTRRNSYGPYGYIHNGADDNASGASGLLEVADAFLKLPAAPRRSIMFAFWDAEESGLLGSKYFVANPTVPLSDITFMINVDMIGRLREKLEFLGIRTAPNLRRLVAEYNFAPGLTLNFNWEMKANSDHYPFASHNVPVLMFHTGLHKDYHRPSDDVERINTSGLEAVSRLLFTTAAEIADRDERLAFRAAGRQESPFDKQQLEQALENLPPRLGVRWRAEEDGAGLVLARVDRGSVAERSGLQVGDRIVSFAGQKIKSADHFRQLVLDAVSPARAQVIKANTKAPTTMNIELDGRPSRIGISWREDNAAPGSVLLTRVVAGSAAAVAGLQIRDRIYEIGGHRFADGKELFQQLVTLPGPIDLTIERNGRIETARLDVLPPRVSAE